SSGRTPTAARTARAPSTPSGRSTARRARPDPATEARAVAARASSARRRFSGAAQRRRVRLTGGRTRGDLRPHERSAMHGVTTELVTSRDDWDAQVDALGGHPLQLWGWGEVKATGAWTPHRLRVLREGELLGVAQVLVRRLPAPFSRLAYVPRGPAVLGDADAEAPADLRERRALVMEEIAKWCRVRIGGVGVSFEPDWAEGSAPAVPGLVEASETVLVPTTVILD